jgi:hypothetical protein
MDSLNLGQMRGGLLLSSRTASINISQFHHSNQRRRRQQSLLVRADGNASKLRDPAHIGGTSRASVPVQDYGGAQSLGKFMNLPPEHYSSLDPNLITSLGGNKFRLRVPRLKLFSLWIEPTVDIAVCSATPQNPRVLLTSESCRLVGSSLIQKMELDKRFALKFSTELTWTSAPDVSQINGNLELDVFTEVIPPFQMLPRSVLEGTCNTVLKTLMKTLLPKFMQLLADDYTKWATDASVRLVSGEEAIK